MSPSDEGAVPPRTTSTPQRAPQAVITDARTSSSEEMSGRVRRYAITMAFRTACFVSMVFVDGWARWVLLAGAVFLPYIAVVVANQADERSRKSRVERGTPSSDAAELTTGPRVEVFRGHVVDGEVVEDLPDESPRGRVA